MDTSLGQIIVRIKQASNDVVVKRKRLEDLKAHTKNVGHMMEKEKLKRIEIEKTLKKTKVELIEAKSHQMVHDLVSVPAVNEVLEEQRIELSNLTEKVEVAKLKAENARKECFDINDSFLLKASEKEQLVMKDIREQTEMYEKKLRILKGRKIS